MKKKLLIILLLLTLNSFSQITKYRSISVVEVENTESGDKYSESKKVDIIITFNLTNRNITVSEKNDRIFNIVKLGSFPDDNNNERTDFNCTNEKGERLTVVLIKYTKPDKNGIEAQVLIKKDSVYIYDVKRIQN